MIGTLATTFEIRMCIEIEIGCEERGGGHHCFAYDSIKCQTCVIPRWMWPSCLPSKGKTGKTAKVIDVLRLVMDRLACISCSQCIVLDV